MSESGNGGGMSNHPVKVLYVLSWGRSGSTLVGNLLAELDGFFHAGELRTIWGKGVMRGRLCGCGRRVAECDVWTSVLSDAFGADIDAVASTAYAHQRSAVRLRDTIPLLRMHPDDLSESAALRAYSDIVRQLYTSLAQKTGSRVIVDSSKRQADAALLGLLEGVEPYFVHLVRDPRAVAYSWQRKKASPGEGERQEMLQYSPTVSTRNWMLMNMAAEALKRRHGRGRSALLRYEDLVADPKRAINALTELVGEPDARLDIPPEGLVLKPNHTAGGNPGRFRKEPLKLRTDDEWLRAQPRRDRFVSTAIALPMLRRYGYDVFPPGARAR